MLFIILFSNTAVYIIRKGNNIISFLAKILCIYYIVIAKQYYKEKWGIGYKIIIYPAKYIKNIIYIYI